MRLQVVVNPAAGGGRCLRALPAVRAALSSQDVVVTPTRSLGHADELVDQALADGRVVVAMGGDGIVGRVAGAVAGRGLMGVLPGGRGNDFCRAVGIPLDPVAACAVLLDAIEVRVDLGRVDGAAFLGIASVGFDSDVQERVLSSRLPLGRLVYLVEALATVASWRPATFTCTVDGSTDIVTGWSLAVANTGVYGAGMRLAPAASVTDNLLDVVSIAAISRTAFLRALPRVFRGSHVDLPAVRLRTARRVELSADRPFRVFADGDPIGRLPCAIEVDPGAVRVLLPRPRGPRR